MKKQKNENLPFSERHPKLSLVIGLLIIITTVGLTAIVIYYLILFLGTVFTKFFGLLSSMASKLDAVIIVALITGTVSISGVIISSIISKIIDYRKNRQEYLAKKREKPYGEFVDMFYKVHQNSKKPGSYSEKQMTEDLLRFSKEITLWGSRKVVNKWVEFRENGANPSAATKNLFLMESIMNEMRKDLGLKRVKKGNILAFVVNDIKQAMWKTKK